MNAKFNLNRKDFGIVYAGMPDDLIRDEVVNQLNLEATPEACAHHHPTRSTCPQWQSCCELPGPPDFFR